MTLRVGALVDGLVAEAWVAEVLAQVEASRSAELVLLVVNEEPRPPRSLRRILPHLLYLLYQRLDRSLSDHDAERRILRAYADRYVRLGDDIPALIPHVYGSCCPHRWNSPRRTRARSR